MPGGLKNAFDSLGSEWRGKTIAFVSYGGSSDVRAGEQWRQFIAILDRRDISRQLSFRPLSDFGNEDFSPAERSVKSAPAMFDQLESAAAAASSSRRRRRIGSSVTERGLGCARSMCHPLCSAVMPSGPPTRVPFLTLCSGRMVKAATGEGDSPSAQGCCRRSSGSAESRGEDSSLIAPRCRLQEFSAISRPGRENARSRRSR